MNLDGRPAGNYDLIICGAGPAGLAAAAALARTGLNIALCGKLPAQTPQNPDTRTAALFTSSLQFLDRIGAWKPLEPRCAPIRAIRIVDATDRLWRAPETLFAGRDVGDVTLGYNCPNTEIVATLVDLVRAQANVTCLFDHRITAVQCGPSNVTIETIRDGGTKAEPLHARLVVAADGRRSLVRTGAGITMRSWSTGQHALTTQFSHSRPHDAVSTEFHRRAGPLTVVPMLGNRSALVWVDARAAIDELLNCDDPAFSRILKAQLKGLLGDLNLLTPRRSFPLTTQIAKCLANRRVVLIGEAAHAFPPIGAQGLNLSLRDVATLSEEIERAVRSGARDLGSDELISAYAKRRSSDVATRVYGVDLLGRSLTSAFLPAALTRGAVLHAANALPMFRRYLIRQGTHLADEQGRPTRPTAALTRNNQQ